MAWKCSRCLRISPSVGPPRPLPTQSVRATFSTYSPSLAPPTKSRPGAAIAPPRGTKMTKNAVRREVGPPAKGKPPERGARRLIRKKLVLSNPNALDILDIGDLSPLSILESGRRARVMSIPKAIVEQLQIMGAFQHTQGWKYFRRPCTLVRQETYELTERMNAIISDPPAGRAYRSIIIGERGSGKSMHILQAMTLAFLNNWVVIHIPEVQELTNAHTDYAPLPDTSPPMYIQKSYTSALLARISAANPILKQLQIMQKHDLPVSLPANASLARLCSLGADHGLAHPVFVALLSELAAPGRPPLLLSLDGLFHAMRPSEYRSPSFEPIHAHSLFLISWFLGHLRGRSPLPNGGMVLAATSESNCPSVPTLRAQLARLEAQQARSQGVASGGAQSPIMPYLAAVGQEAPAIQPLDPYSQLDGRVLEALGAPAPDSDDSLSSLSVQPHEAVSPFEIVRLHGLSMEEARSLMEYWAQSGMMRDEIDNRLSAAKWMLSGNGLVGELERGCVRMTA